MVSHLWGCDVRSLGNDIRCRKFPFALSDQTQATALWTGEAAMAVGYPEIRRRGICSKSQYYSILSVALTLLFSRNMARTWKTWFHHRLSHPARPQQGQLLQGRHLHQNVPRPHRNPVSRSPSCPPSCTSTQTRPFRWKEADIWLDEPFVQGSSPRLSCPIPSS